MHVSSLLFRSACTFLVVVAVGSRKLARSFSILPHHQWLLEPMLPRAVLEAGQCLVLTVGLCNLPHAPPRKGTYALVITDTVHLTSRAKAQRLSKSVHLHRHVHSSLGRLSSLITMLAVSPTFTAACATPVHPAPQASCPWSC